MSGWRPHTDQVGQTGNKIAPEIYIACGVSGATQHIAGCKGAKRILAVNTDPEAPIMSIADYAVVGDLHEVLPAISAELRRRRGRVGARRSLARRAARWSTTDLRRSRSSVVLGVAGTLFGRRALMLTRLVRLGQAGAALRRRAAARAQRGRRRARAEEAVPAARPGPDPRLHLLGLPRPLPDDRDGADRAPSRRARRCRGSATRAGSRSSSTSSSCSCSSASRRRSGSARCSGPSGSRAATSARPT